MPLYKSITIADETHVLVWKITESLEQLTDEIALKEVCRTRVDGMKSEQHRRGFLSVRKLLQEIGYTDFDLYYDSDGKPRLKDGKNISITHSYSFSAIIVSPHNVGIDMEMQREKVITIADKFIEPEFEYLDPTHLTDYMQRLIVIWGVKEALFKMISREGMSFKQNMYVHPFTMQDSEGRATVIFEDINRDFTFSFEEVADFMLVYSLEHSNNLKYKP